MAANNESFINCTQDVDVSSATKPQLHVILLSLSIALLALAIFSGNLLVILAIALNRRLHNITGAYITSLAVGDMLIALLAVPLIIVSNIAGPTMKNNGGLQSCHFTISLAITLMFNSIANLSAISLDRYVAIMKPLRYKALMTNRRTAAIIAFVWFFSTVFGFIPYMGWRRIYPRKPDDKGLYCQVPLNLDGSYILTVCFVALVPSLFMLVAYYRIFKTAKYHTSMIANAINNVIQNHGEAKNIDIVKEAKAAKMVCMVLGSFLLCWFPLFVIMLSEVAHMYVVHSYVYAGSVMFATVNSAFNPCIYAANNREYRITFKSLLLCRKPGNRIGVVPP